MVIARGALGPSAWVSGLDFMPQPGLADFAGLTA
nr:hypothetical protein [Hyphobacterium sp. SN044]